MQMTNGLNEFMVDLNIIKVFMYLFKMLLNETVFSNDCMIDMERSTLFTSERLTVET
jgi:hypothetical protein